MEKELLFNGDTTTACSIDFNWNPISGNSWYYYVNSGDYKIDDHGESVVVDVLVAGVNKEDIKAYIEGTILSVETSKPGWNGNVNVTIDMSFLPANLGSPSVKLNNGVLRVEFPKIDEKKKLEIE